MSCKPSTIFGEPNKGVHAYRIFGLAAVDLIGTIIIAYLIARFVKWEQLGKNMWIRFFVVFMLLMLLSLILHKLFCVHTTLTNAIMPY